MDTTNELFRQSFRNLIQSKSFEKILYTDSSKSDPSVGCKFSSENETISSYRLLDLGRVFNGELHPEGNQIAIHSKAYCSLHPCRVQAQMERQYHCLRRTLFEILSNTDQLIRRLLDSFSFAVLFDMKCKIDIENLLTMT